MSGLYPLTLAEKVARAHARVVADHSLQFALAQAPSPHAPSWLMAMMKALAAGWPVLRVLFLVAIAVAALMVIVTIARTVAARIARRAPARRAALSLQGHGESLRPPARRARALLEEAYALAAAGRFDEAAHVLLYRTIDDLEGRRPRAVRPALTSRDIAALEVIPPPARGAFAVIAEVVERSFFGGRRLDAGAFAACRQAYEAFVSPQSWAAGAPT
jgi:hypothetical protein